MNKRGRWLMVLCVFSVALTALPMLPVWMPPPSAEPGRAGKSESESAEGPRSVVVELRDGDSASDISDLDAKLGTNLQPNETGETGDRVLRLDNLDAATADKLLGELRGDARVASAEPEVDFSLPESNPRMNEAPVTDTSIGKRILSFLHRDYIPNDPRFAEQWNLDMMGAPQAWRRSTGQGIVVAVIDTGVAGWDSPRGRRAKDFAQTRFVPGYDFVHHDKDPYDDHGHGTHVAGTIAESTNNGEGAAGLAFDAKIMPLKVLSSRGSGNSSDIADAIRYAADHGANVINMSLGSYTPSEVVHDACKYAARKGVVIVCAAGNGFGEGVGYPAAYPECIAVSAVGPTGNLAVYSSYGPQVAIAAPGGDMLGSGKRSDGILQNTILSPAIGGHGDDYYFFNGTSMASPHVAALVALLEAQGVRDPARIRDLLIRTAVPHAEKLKYGAGVVSADAATAAVVRDANLLELKRIVLLVLAMLLLLSAAGLEPSERLQLATALVAGGIAPDFLAGHFAANSVWNLVGYSALLPFLLFWELEVRHGSRVVACFALGVAYCLGWSLLLGGMPWLVSVFGHRAVPFTVANIGAALVLAGLAWARADAPRASRS